MRVSAAPNSSTSSSTSAGSSDVSTSCAIVADRSAAGTELPEGLFLGGPGQPRLGPRDDEHGAPLLGHRVAREQRAPYVPRRGARRPRPRGRRARTSTCPPRSAPRARPPAPGPARRPSARAAPPAPAPPRAPASCPTRARRAAGSPRRTRRCAPPASPSASWQRRANVSARSASAPSADSSSAGSASITTAGRPTDTPSPPKRRPLSPATASMPRCRRAGASTRTAVTGPRPLLAGGA